MVKIARIWFAKDTVAKIDLATNVTITTSAALDTFFSSSTAFDAQLKDVTITEPMRNAEKVDLQGTDANGYQNAELEEKPGDNGELTATLILKGDEVIEAFIYDAGTAINGTHTRYKPGLAAIRKLAFLINLDDGTDEVNIAITNAVCKAKDTKISAADGHYEVPITATVLPRDFHGPEFKD